jgi:formate dehydrogenase major subunit
MPHALAHETLEKFVELNSSPSGWWGNMDAYTVSLLKAYWGEHATSDNDFCFDYLPRISGDHSAYWAAMEMLDGRMKGYLLLGENPAVGSANGRLNRLALANLDWLVVRDLFDTESASFWHSSPEIESGELASERIKTEVFFMPAAAHVEKDGSFTNTQRLLQWHHKASNRKGTAAPSSGSPTTWAGSFNASSPDRPIRKTGRSWT